MKNISLALALAFSATAIVSCNDSDSVSSTQPMQSAQNQQSLNQQNLKRDGIYSGDQFTSYVDKAGVFTKYDTNSDNAIDQDEYNRLGMKGDFTTWDNDRDSRLNEEEFNSGAYRSFDENNDGRWDEGEWEAARNSRLFEDY